MSCINMTKMYWHNYALRPCLLAVDQLSPRVELADIMHYYVMH